MNNKYIRKLFAVMVVGTVMMTTRLAYAEENVSDLKRQIEELKEKVATLEAGQNAAVKPWPPAVPAQDPWDPWADMGRMHQEMEAMFQSAMDQARGARQGMFSNQLFFDTSKLEETKDGYSIKLDVKGFDQNKIDIKAQEGSLVISGEYRDQEKSERQNSVYESHNYGKFLNTVPLPKDADVSGMKIEKKGDQLVIFLPKKK